MGIQDLQLLMDDSSIEGSCVGIDLVRIARSQTREWIKQAGKKLPNGIPGGLPHDVVMESFNLTVPRLSLVIDAECCLDRLYGGYFSDWVCGGQWNRAVTFLGQLINSLSLSNIDIVVFFNGCAEPMRNGEWINEQVKIRQNITQVLRHLSNKGTPPPKVWWTPPSCLRQVIRMILRNLNVPVFVTSEDHRQEVIAYCRDNNCHGIIADDAEYLVFNPPRYFSARHLKLTYKRTLESKEYSVAALIKHLGLTNDQLCILAALLGNFILPESELTDLDKKLNLEMNDGQTNKASGPLSLNWKPNTVRAIAAFVKSLKSKDLDGLGMEIFGVVGDERAAKFKKAAQYYMDGAKGGYFRSKSLENQSKKTRKTKNGEEEVDSRVMGISSSEPGLDTSRLASDAKGNSELVSGIISVSEAFACLSVGEQKPTGVINGGTAAPVSVLASGSSEPGATESGRPSTEPQNPKQKKHVRLLVDDDKTPNNLPTLPPVSSEIVRTVSERHGNGLMSPLIYQVLTQKEIRLPVLLEDESSKEFPSIQKFYQPLRAMIYAILFNLNHMTYLARNGFKPKDGENDNRVPEIKIKEWIWSKSNPFVWPETVKAEPLGWGVPTIQRLWFGTTVDDKRRRLRAYLTVMRSDTQRMLNPSYVPQHLLVLATVLRYIMTDPDQRRVLRKHELDAIIATAVDPHLADPEYNQELEVDYVSPRGAQIGALLMTGVEYALAANDACGAPIPWMMTFPWLYFDGKLLHSTLARSANVKNLLELCSHRVPQVLRVEQMREAILEDIAALWARPPLMNQLNNPDDSSRVHAVMPAGMNPRGIARGSASTTPAIRGGRGGRLEIAGVVVGNWGPNSRFHHQMPPQVTSVGGGQNYSVSSRGGLSKGASYSTRGGVNNGRLNSNGKRGGGSFNNSNKFQLLNQKKGKSHYFPNNMKRDAGRKLSRGRGLTVVNPMTGETMQATKFIAQTEPELEEKKRILTNSDSRKKISSRTTAVNGQSHKNENKEQFEDAVSHGAIYGGSTTLDN